MKTSTQLIILIITSFNWLIACTDTEAPRGGTLVMLDTEDGDQRANGTNLFLNDIIDNDDQDSGDQGNNNSNTNNSDDNNNDSQENGDQNTGDQGNNNNNNSNTNNSDDNNNDSQENGDQNTGDQDDNNNNDGDNNVELIGTFNVVKPVNYATGNLLHSSQIGAPSRATIFTDDTNIGTRFQAASMGDYFYTTNEFGAWTTIDGVNLRTIPQWQMESTLSASAPFVSYDYNFGSRQARVDQMPLLGFPNFASNFIGDHFYVPAAYPTLTYGVNRTRTGDQFKIESPNLAQLPLPALLSDLPDFVVDYTFQSSENTLDANNFFFNGQNFYHERNIALESFFHSDCSGNDTNPTTEEYEIMLWFDRGPERAPDRASSLAGDVTIDGRTYEVWTKDRKGPGYIAFVDKNSATSYQGQVNWSLFVKWVQAHGHQMKTVFNNPTLFNQPVLQSNYCMSNILIGNEIWWGSGKFELEQWDIKAYDSAR